MCLFSHKHVRPSVWTCRCESHHSSKALSGNWILWRKHTHTSRSVFLEHVWLKPVYIPYIDRSGQTDRQLDKDVYRARPCYWDFHLAGVLIQTSCQLYWAVLHFSLVGLFRLASIACCLNMPLGWTFYILFSSLRILSSWACTLHLNPGWDRKTRSIRPDVAAFTLISCVSQSWCIL